MNKIMLLPLAILLFLLAAPAKPQLKAAEDPAALFRLTCDQCHSVEIPLSERRDRKGWKYTVDNMRNYGAQLTDQQAETIIDYLTRERGLK